MYRTRSTEVARGRSGCAVTGVRKKVLAVLANIRHPGSAIDLLTLRDIGEYASEPYATDQRSGQACGKALSLP